MSTNYQNYKSCQPRDKHFSSISHFFLETSMCFRIGVNQWHGAQQYRLTVPPRGSVILLQGERTNFTGVFLGCSDSLPLRKSVFACHKKSNQRSKFKRITSKKSGTRSESWLPRFEGLRHCLIHCGGALLVLWEVSLPHETRFGAMPALPPRT